MGKATLGGGWEGVKGAPTASDAKGAIYGVGGGDDVKKKANRITGTQTARQKAYAVGADGSRQLLDASK
jgi:hypothetical protein